MCLLHCQGNLKFSDDKQYSGDFRGEVQGVLVNRPVRESPDYRKCERKVDRKGQMITVTERANHSREKNLLDGRCARDIKR